MGMDVYIEPEFSNRYNELKPSFNEAVERRNNAKTEEERKEAQKEVDKYFNQIHEQFYFRTQYNPYGLQHWLDANICEGYDAWGLSIFDPTHDPDKRVITDVEKVKAMLRTVNKWIERTNTLKTSVLWVPSWCIEDYKKEAIKTRVRYFGKQEKLVRLSADDTKDYKDWLNDLKVFLEEAVDLVAKGSRIVISA